MIDLNIVADGNTAKLLALEAERAGLQYKVSAQPISGAKIYVVDAVLGNVGALSPLNTIVIGEAKGFSRNLSNPFLLSDLRAALSDLIANLSARKERVPSSKKKKSLSITVDLNTSSAIVYDKKVSLSPTEAALLDALVSRRGEILSYEEAEKVIGGDGSNKVNVYICFLRKKLEIGCEKIIYSVRGKGFMIK